MFEFNRKLKEQEFYSDGMNDGRQIYFYDNGKIKEDKIFNMGSLNGEYKKY